MSKTFIGGAVCREFESEAPYIGRQTNRDYNIAEALSINYSIVYNYLPRITRNIEEYKSGTQVKWEG